MINVSQTAASKINELLTEEGKTGSGLRVFVQGGGCSGFHGLMIEEGGGAGDQVFESNGVKLFVDPRQHQLPQGRGSGLCRHGHRRRFHHQEPERRLHVRVRVIVQRLPSVATTLEDLPAEAFGRETVQQAGTDRQRVPASRGHLSADDLAISSAARTIASAAPPSTAPCSGWWTPALPAKFFGKAGSASSIPTASLGIFT